MTTLPIFGVLFSLGHFVHKQYVVLHKFNRRKTAQIKKLHHNAIKLKRKLLTINTLASYIYFIFLRGYFLMPQHNFCCCHLTTKQQFNSFSADSYTLFCPMTH